MIFNAGVSEAGKSFIAAEADYAFFAVTEDLKAVKATVDDLAARTAAADRDPLSVSAAGSIGIVIGQTTEEAEEKFASIVDSMDMDAARGWAKGFLGGSQTYQKMFGSDLDAAARKIGVAAGSTVLVGTAKEVADQLIDIHRETGLRGYMLLTLDWNPEEVALIGDVFPYLEEAGVWIPPAKRDWSW